MVDYLWSHALISDEDYANHRCIASNSSHQTQSRTFYFQSESDRGKINIYNIYAPLCPSHPDPIWRFSNFTSFSLTEDSPMNGLDGYDSCSPGYVLAYLNTAKVQSALHANVTSLPYLWKECSNVLTYNSINVTSMLPIYQRMMVAGLRILVYSGDIDGRLPVTSTRYSINVMNLPIEKAWYPWMDGDIDVAGYSVIYKGLIFATVRGAGHEVPSYQPSRALTMTKYFLAGKPLPS